jgi:hypothetical protein
MASNGAGTFFASVAPHGSSHPHVHRGSLSEMLIGQTVRVEVGDDLE